MLVRMLYGYKATQCLYIAAKLDIADHLLSGEKNISELAQLTNSNSDALYRVLRCLVSLDFFQENNSESFSLNENSRQLLTNSDNTIKNFVILCGEELYHSAGDLLYTVKSGLPAFNHIYGMSHWEYLDKHPDKAETFHSAMETGSRPIIKALMDHYDFSPYKHIIDIGGGKGHLVSEILLQHPNSHGIVFDLDNATKFSTQYINEKNLSDRCTVVTGNFFESVPDSGDIYLLKVILHDWDDSHALLILKNCQKSMTKKSKLLIIEKVIGDAKFKDSACLGDINMLVTYMGKERTLLEFEKLLNDAGLVLSKKINTNTAFSIIEAELL